MDPCFIQRTVEYNGGIFVYECAVLFVLQFTYKLTISMHRTVAVACFVGDDWIVCMIHLFKKVLQYINLQNYYYGPRWRPIFVGLIKLMHPVTKNCSVHHK
jgi:hypothetical protein